MNAIVASFLVFLSSAPVITLLALLAADVVLSIIAALKNGTFDLHKAGDFVGSRVGPFVVYLVIAALSVVVGQPYTAIAIAIYTGLVALYGTAILAAVKDITGLQIPAALTGKKPPTQ